jgi:hypothetical protein
VRGSPAGRSKVYVRLICHAVKRRRTATPAAEFQSIIELGEAPRWVVSISRAKTQCILSAMRAT